MEPNSPNQLKIFSREEAEALLPRLSAMVRDLQAKREKIISLEVEIDALELVTDRRDDSGAAPPLSKKVDEYTRTMAAFYAGVDEIHSLGCFLKDLELGLVDFYTVQKNKGIFLCWKIGESRIEHWHDIDKGFTSREKIE